MIPGAHDPQRPAVVMAASGEVLTYGELDAAANRIARLLRSMGLEPGDHIALCLENSPRFFEVVWGAHYAGLLYTACSTRLTPDEFTYVVDDCGAKVVVVSRSATASSPRRSATPRRTWSDACRRAARSMAGSRSRSSPPDTTRLRCPSRGSPAATCSIRPARQGARRASAQRS